MANKKAIRRFCCFDWVSIISNLMGVFIQPNTNDSHSNHADIYLYWLNNKLTNKFYSNWIHTRNSARFIHCAMLCYASYNVLLWKFMNTTINRMWLVHSNEWNKCYSQIITMFNEQWTLNTSFCFVFAALFICFFPFYSAWVWNCHVGMLKTKNLSSSKNRWGFF